MVQDMSGAVAGSAASGSWRRSDGIDLRRAARQAAPAHPGPPRKWAGSTGEILHSQEYGRGVAASAVAFRPMSENSDGPLYPTSSHSYIHHVHLTTSSDILFLPKSPAMHCTIFSQHDNASPRTAKETTNDLGTLDMEILVHPPYSPDLTPYDFYLLSIIKEKRREKWFMDVEEAAAACGKASKRPPKCQTLRLTHVTREEMNQYDTRLLPTRIELSMRAKQPPAGERQELGQRAPVP
ncbi:Histone-lysine N-methyltransferase SETMAR [Eumeta japonica]|uniref:Histone-lysine N-methyltransferase SETMAR n=1 Tax=Eumeta variegata TaxID=151549 RepID=A0A4C1ZRZ9_EUMVA|nr:Histone-lysine N-methyltransferase SETMAR [Eumeta japonica]